MKLLRKYKVIFILITINFKLNCQYIPGIEQTDLYFDKLKSKNKNLILNNIDKNNKKRFYNKCWGESSPK